jgi:micrococcal nuclease
VSTRTAALWVLGFFALALAGGGLAVFGGDDSGRNEPLKAAATGLVVRVVDGDTVKVRIGDRVRTVRYIGVDTPESVKPGTPVQCYAKPASHFNERLVEGRRVRLRYGPEHYDRYGRVLAYVYLASDRHAFVNAELVRRGYVRTLAIAPNTQFAGRFARLERRAQREGLGLWSACPGE